MKLRMPYCLIVLLLLIVSCSNNDNANIDHAYRIVAEEPDSALTILNGVDRQQLSKSEEARYALVYTIAQDKSGLDVGNDSLIGLAFSYYDERPDDSLYAKCQYYMGKYYMLNLWTEKAIDCFDKSANGAEKDSDKYTLCLALEKWSKLLSGTEPQKAIPLIKKAIAVYATIPDAPKVNAAYFKLGLSDALLQSDSLKAAEHVCQEAINIANAVGDKVALSDACQDMANILNGMKRFREELDYSKRAYSLSDVPDDTKLLNLAWAYLNVDSLASSAKILRNIKSSDPTTLYIFNYLHHIAAIKSGKFSDACQYADSSYHYIEKMYADEATKKDNYYSAYVQSKFEKGVMECRAKTMKQLVICITIAALIIILMLVLSYRQYRAKAKMKMEVEKKDHEMKEQLHKEMLRHKEVQISMMRDFILQKVNTAQKIEEIKNNQGENISLTDPDWEEINLFVEKVEGDFVPRLMEKFPQLSDSEKRFLILVRLKIPTKVLSSIYGISEKSVRQKLYVFKSKVGIEGKDCTLRDFIEAF